MEDWSPCFNRTATNEASMKSAKCDVFVFHSSQLSFPWCYILWLHAKLVRKGDTFWLSLSLWTYFTEFNLTFKENEAKLHIFLYKGAWGISHIVTTWEPSFSLCPFLVSSIPPCRWIPDPFLITSCILISISRIYILGNSLYLLELFISEYESHNIWEPLCCYWLPWWLRG